MKRALLGVLGVLLVLAGACGLAISAWVYSAFGSDGVASATLGQLTSSPTSTAMAIDVQSASVRIPVIPVQGTTTVRFSTSGPIEIAAGSVSRAEADSFTTAQAIDVAYRREGGWVLTHVAGMAVPDSPKPLPAWLSSGRAVTVDVTAGNTIVIANADGSPGISVEAALQFSAPRAPLAALILAISGGVVVCAGITVVICSIWIMRRRPDERPE